MTYTEELAYKQAEEADNLLSRGVYLGILVSYVNKTTID